MVTVFGNQNCGQHVPSLSLCHAAGSCTAAVLPAEQPRLLPCALSCLQWRACLPTSLSARWAARRARCSRCSAAREGSGSCFCTPPFRSTRFSQLMSCPCLHDLLSSKDINISGWAAELDGQQNWMGSINDWLGGFIEAGPLSQALAELRGWVGAVDRRQRPPHGMPAGPPPVLAALLAALACARPPAASRCIRPSLLTRPTSLPAAPPPPSAVALTLFCPTRAPAGPSDSSGTAAQVRRGLAAAAACRHRVQIGEEPGPRSKQDHQCRIALRRGASAAHSASSAPPLPRRRPSRFHTPHFATAPACLRALLPLGQHPQHQSHTSCHEQQPVSGAQQQRAPSSSSGGARWARLSLLITPRLS